MENLDRRMLLAGLGLVGAAAAASAASAGTLNPPAGPVAPTGKTTDEIEPRIDVAVLAGDAGAQHVIIQPGSYYLTGNLAGISGKVCIAIASDGVTLDLCGFALQGVAGALAAIEWRSTKDTVIRNGTVTGFANGPAVSAVNFSSNVMSLRVEDLSVSNCASGIGTGFVGEVSRCEVINCTNPTGSCVGVAADIVTQCRVDGITGSGDTYGIQGTVVADCVVRNVNVAGAALLRGIGAGDGSVSNCCVSYVGTTSPTTVVGVESACVTGCLVFAIESSAPGTSVVGIQSLGTVSHCVVATTGSGLPTTGTTGISAQSVTGCRVQSLTGTLVIGISADMTTNSTVEFIAQVAGGGLPARGIAGKVVSDCFVATVNGNSTVTAVGIGSYALARNCQVEAITNAGSTNVSYFAPASSAETLDCNAAGSTIGAIGIQATFGNVIRNCRVSLTVSGATGISCTSTDNVIDGNNIRSCAIGISVTGTALVIRNQVRACTTNFSLAANCQSGPVVNTVGVIASTNPWANFTD